MKLEKKHWIIIGVVVAIIFVWYFLRKKKSESSFKEPDCPGCQCVGGTVNCVSGESDWKPEFVNVKDELRSLQEFI